jgi:hypothetical protein
MFEDIDKCRVWDWHDQNQQVYSTHPHIVYFDDWTYGGR